MVNLGRYQVLRAIGHGGMGEVFEAWDLQLERRVALKILPDPDDGPALREARCVARVAHPHVVGVHEVGRCDGLVFIAMELVDGPDFGTWLCEHAHHWTDVLDRLLDAARGLSAVHRAGLVHGDVKPSNVLIGEDGRVRIADFGLAQVRSCAAPDLVREAAAVVEAELTGASGMTPTSSPHPVGGTRAYMAPECLVGGGGDRRSDQWSFCVMAWEALFGARPYAGHSAEAILGSIAAARLDRGRGRPRGMPSGIEAVLARGLSEDPDQRWADIDVLIVELERRRGRGGALARRLTIGALAVCSTLAGLALAHAEPRGEVDQCVVERERLEGAWGATERARFEQRMMSSSIVLPRREIRFVSAHLDTWVAEWSRLWTHACAPEPLDPAIRDCLIDERERLEAVVALLLDDRRDPSIELGRALMAELELPTVCLDRTRRGASASDLGHLAELSEVEHRVEVALAGEDLEGAAEHVLELDARVNRLSEVGRLVPASRVRVVHWQVRLLHAQGEHREAKRMLRWALTEAERLGLEHLRWDLLLARAQLSAETGESVLDEVAELDVLADRLGQGDEARAELALVEASASEDPIASIARLDRAYNRLDRVVGSSRARSLLFEVLLARSELHRRASNLDAALHDATVAVVLARTPDLLDDDRLARAYMLLAEISTRADRCDLLTDMLDDLGTILIHMREGSRPILDLGWMFDIPRSFQAPVAPECARAQLRAWMLAQSSI